MRVDDRNRDRAAGGGSRSGREKHLTSPAQGEKERFERWESKFQNQ